MLNSIEFRNIKWYKAMSSLSEEFLIQFNKLKSVYGKRVTQKDIASISGISQATITNIIKGAENPDQVGDIYPYVDITKVQKVIGAITMLDIEEKELTSILNPSFVELSKVYALSLLSDPKETINPGLFYQKADENLESKKVLEQFLVYAIRPKKEIAKGVYIIYEDYTFQYRAKSNRGMINRTLYFYGNVDVTTKKGYEFFITNYTRFGGQHYPLEPYRNYVVFNQPTHKGLNFGIYNSPPRNFKSSIPAFVFKMQRFFYPMDKDIDLEEPEIISEQTYKGVITGKDMKDKLKEIDIQNLKACQDYFEEENTMDFQLILK